MNIEEFEKIMQRDDKEEKEEDLEKIWDSKSEWFFKRTEKKQENFSDRLIFKIVKEKKLLNENSKVLDIGCGTGRHLLEFSKFTSYVTGTDISSKMLDYAKEKLKNVSEAKFVHGNWMENFTKEKEFDLVFASMTPAIRTIEHIKRMCLTSKKYCMMERFVYYRDSIREEIEKTVTEYMEQIICADDEENKIIEFLKGKEKNGKIMSKEYIIKAIILWDVNIF